MVLSPAQLAGLAAGHGDDATLKVLRAGQLGRRRLLTVAAARAGGDGPSVRECLALLTRAERADPAAVAHVLAHPPVTGWATTALRGHPDAGYLAGLAVAAAVRAGLPFTLTVPCPGGALLLPTVGGAVGLGAGLAVVRGVGGRYDGRPAPDGVAPPGLSVHGPAGAVYASTGGPGDGPGPARPWLPSRRITAFRDTPPAEVLVDDQDPYRHRYHQPPTARLDDAAAARLDRLTGRAWHWLTARLPAHARGLAALLRSLVPLTPPPSGHPVSATSRAALGAIAVSVPADPETLALLLVHELQHTKLGALLDLLPLHAPGGPARYRAPWRWDPRPVGALLQGTYAHLGVAEVWRCRRHEGVRSAFEYAYWREQTARAVTQLAGSAELTDDGRAFVTGMAGTLRGWGADGDGPVEAAARDVADGGAVRWALANLAPVDDDVDETAHAWRRGRRSPPPVTPPAVVPGAARPALTGDTGPEAAVRRRLLGTADRRSARPGVDPVPSRTGDAALHLDEADRAYATGDAPAALAGYSRRLTGDPGDTDALVGVALAAGRLGRTAAARVLTTRPDLVRALCHRLPGADPVAVATWLAVGPA
ncbi:HEXXH motif-containing putative peptide modification protein [Micromonospora peucetia]|uniref:aKG-HExxH-type peptide beta-hydroxylase n=1 Tax=Micromonospora peucetia TaxID=47871 RepID=UPI002259636A|nr:HEXXH motif-containing putative peptide modification protein [Micromonospora peucetia]MCX4390605.1 HEXXH motif-containing putative peptide modification protein [Micromonospora peucetia]